MPLHPSINFLTIILSQCIAPIIFTLWLNFKQLKIMEEKKIDIECVFYEIWLLSNKTLFFTTFSKYCLKFSHKEGVKFSSQVNTHS